MMIIVAAVLLSSTWAHLTISQEMDDTIQSDDITINAWNPAAGEFPMFRGDRSNTGNVSDVGPESYKLRFSLPLGGYCSPVIKYDHLYYASSKAVWCYDLNGTLVWKYDTGDLHWNTPLVYQGRVYAAGDTGKVWCLSANATGQGTTTNHWTYTPPDTVASCTASPTTDGSRIFYSYGTNSNGMVSLWMSNGTMAWNASLDASTSIEGSPAYWNGLVFTGAGDSYRRGSDYLYCFHAQNGTLAWKFDASSPVCTSPAIEYGRVYFGGGDRRVYCLDALGSSGQPVKYWDYLTTAPIASSPAVSYGRVYIGDEGRNAYFYCLDAYGSGGSTTSYWRVSLTPAGRFGVCSSPVTTETSIYVGTTGNAFYCLNRSDGATRWTETYDGSDYGISSSPAVFNGMVSFVSDNGPLFVVEEKTDFDPPIVNSTYPSGGRYQVPLDVNITIEFNEAVDPGTIDEDSIHLEWLGDPIESEIGYNEDDNSAWLKPLEPLSKERRYVVSVEPTICDLSANYLDGDGNGVHDGAGDRYVFSFWSLNFSKPVIDLDVIRAVEDIEKTIRLSDHISDEDTPFTELEILENSTYADIDDGMMVLLYPQGVTHDVINLSASDGRSTTYRDIVVNITAENDPPSILPLDPLELTEDIAHLLDLSKKVFDQDGDLLEITAESDHAEVNGTDVVFLYPEGILQEQVVISVSDGIDTDWTILEITVIPVNDPPVIDHVNGEAGSSHEIFIFEDEETEVFISYHDVDGPEPELILEPELEMMGLDPVNGIIVFDPKQDDIGPYSITVTVRDPELNYLKDTVELNVTVLNVNDPPVPSTIEFISGGTENLTVRLRTSIAEDEDLDALTYSWDLGDGTVIRDELEIVHTYSGPGAYTVVLTVSDGTDPISVQLGLDVTAPVVIDPVDDDDDDDIIIIDDDDDPPANDTNDDADRSTDENGSIIPLVLVLLGILVLIFAGVVGFLFIKRRGSGDDEEVWDDPDSFIEKYSDKVDEEV